MFSFSDARNLRGDDAKVEALGRNQGLIGESSPVPTRLALSNPSAASPGTAKRDKCQKGKSCKATCIYKLDECLEEFPESATAAIRDVSSFLSRQVEKGLISEDVAEEVTSTFRTLDKSQLKAYEVYKSMVDSGKVSDQEKDMVARLLISTIVTPGQDRNAPRVMSFDDIESVLKPGNLDRLEKAYQSSFGKEGKFDPSQPGGMGDLIKNTYLVNQISDPVAIAAYGMLPSKVRSAIDKAGSVKGEGILYAGDDKDGNPTFSDSPTRERGIFLVRRWMEQGGLDPYTGKPIDIRNAEPEHMVAFAHALAKGGGGDQPKNLLWASAGPNNQKAGAGDDFLQWKSNLEKFQKMGRERYEKEVFNPAVEAAQARKGKKAQAPTELSKAMDSVSREERIENVKKLVQSYGKEIRYLIRASGVGWQHQDRDLDHRKGGQPAFMDNGIPRLPGTKVKPSTAVLVALAAVDPEKRSELISRLETLRKGRILSDAEAERVRGDNSARLALQKQKTEEYADELSATLDQFVPGIENLLE